MYDILFTLFRFEIVNIPQWKEDWAKTLGIFQIPANFPRNVALRHDLRSLTNFVQFESNYPFETIHTALNTVFSKKMHPRLLLGKTKLYW